MKAALVIASITLSAALALAQFPPTPIEYVWEGMYPPPYVQSPQIALALDCVSENLCYIAGGSNGVGFGVYQYDGKMQGSINGPMTEPNMSMMVMDIAVGGTEDEPKGAFSAVVDFTIGKGLQYLAQKGTEWLPSVMPVELVWASTSIVGSADGSHLVAVGDGITGADLMISNDFGHTFVQQNINWKAPDNCSAAGYIATPSRDVWYLTWANQPPQKSGSSSSGSSGGSQGTHQTAGIDAKYLTAEEVIVRRKANGQVLVIKNARTGAVRTHVKTPVQWRNDLKEVQDQSDSQCNYYKGYILKSTDRGNTWRLVYQNNIAATSYISCFDAEHCVVTAFNAGESYTITTINGDHFKVTYTTPPSSQTSAESVSAIAFASANEVWVGGSYESQTAGKGMFWYSKDSGMTWSQYKHTIPDVMVIMSMDFINGVGFALGMTMFKTTQIMRYKKQADFGNFVQKQCPIAGCTILCQSLSFPQGMCLSANGGSAKAFCEADGLAQYSFQTTSCIGAWTKTVQPINQCLNGTSTYFVNECPTGEGKPIKARPAGRNDKLAH